MRSKPADPRPDARTDRLVLLLVFAIGVIAVNLYASQPLVELIGPAIGLRKDLVGLVPTTTMLGYTAGMIAVVPLIDLVENRRLILWMLAGGVIALTAAMFISSAMAFLAASFAIGVAACSIHMLVPTAAFLVPDMQRGLVIGRVQSGMMLGVLLSRPIASLIAAGLGWRAFYGFAAALLALAGVGLGAILPRRQPATSAGYGTLLVSLWTLLRDEPVLRRRTIYQALCMGAFGVFWTAVPLRLAQAPFHLGQPGIALFALAGAGGVAIGPWAGRAGDRGLTQPATRLAHLGIVAAMLLAAVAGGTPLTGFDPSANPTSALLLLAASGVLIDMAFIGDQTLGRRAINLLRPEARGRVNGLFTGLFFLGGAAGAGVASPAWAHGGWPLVCMIGLAFGATALMLSGIDAKHAWSVGN